MLAGQLDSKMLLNYSVRKLRYPTKAMKHLFLKSPNADNWISKQNGIFSNSNSRNLWNLLSYKIYFHC